MPNSRTTTGLPPGVLAGATGPRLLAALVEVGPVWLLVGLALLFAFVLNGSVLVVVLCLVIALAWAALVWAQRATRAAGPGMRLDSLQVVGLSDGRPLGWGRVLLRGLVFAGLTVTVVGLVGHADRAHPAPASSGLARPRGQRRGDQGTTVGPAPAEGRRGADRATEARRDRGLPREEAIGRGHRRHGSGREATGRLCGRRRATEAEETVVVRPGAARGPRSPGLRPPDRRPPRRASRANPPTRPARPLRTPRTPPARPRAGGLAEWMLRLDDGRNVAVEGLVLLGRNPQPRVGEEDAKLIKVSDDTRTVSKSHLAVGVDVTGLYVMDRGSTNGTMVTAPDGGQRPCPPGDLVDVPGGSVISFGDHWLEVHRPGH